MKKSIFTKTVATIVLFFACLSCFAKSKKDVKTLSVACLDGPTGIPTAYLMENVKTLAKFPVKYQKFASPNQFLAKLIAKEIDIGFLPVNVAAKAFNSTNGKVVTLGVASEGMLFLMTKQQGMKDLSALKGKTVAVAGAGATPDYLFRYILKENGIKEDDVSLDFSIPTAQIPPALISGKIEYAVLPEPFASAACAKDKSIYEAFDLQKEYQKITGKENFPMVLLVARADFAKDNPKVVTAFQKAYDEAQNWTKTNVDKASELCEKYDFGLQKSVIQMSIPNIAFSYASPLAAKDKIESILQIFLDFDKEAIGEKLPSKDFYFN